MISPIKVNTARSSSCQIPASTNAAVTSNFIMVFVSVCQPSTTRVSNMIGSSIFGSFAAANFNMNVFMIFYFMKNRLKGYVLSMKLFSCGQSSGFPVND